MSDLFAIDPGVRQCAVAVAANSNLVDTRMVPSHEMPRPSSPYCDVILEKPQADGRSMTTDDAIALTEAGANLARAVAGREHSVRAVTVREWKGGVPKPIHHARLWAVLTDAERDILGGLATARAIQLACERGAVDRWAKDGKLFYRARELPTVDGLKITHDILDAAALLMFGLGRLPGP